jgi:CubicO group peptidase (beta-lactamase class C family)
MGSPQLEPSQFPPDGATFLGWSPEGRNFGFGVQVTTDAELTPQLDRDGDFGWNGAYQTDWFASPSTGVAAVIMLQSAGGPNRPPLDVGGDLRRLVYQALTED